MKNGIKAWWGRVLAWWNWKDALAKKDEEIISLRKQVKELAEKNLELEEQTYQYESDIILMAENVRKERQSHTEELEIRDVKYALLERRVPKEAAMT